MKSGIGLGLGLTLMNSHVEAESRAEVAHSLAELLKLSKAHRQGHEKGECEVRTHHDLLNVDDDDIVISQDLAHATGNSRTIRPGQGEQEGLCGCIIHRTETSADWLLPSA